MPGEDLARARRMMSAFPGDPGTDHLGLTIYSVILPASSHVAAPMHGMKRPATYTVTWKNGETVLETDTGVAAGAAPSYDIFAHFEMVGITFVN